MSSVTTPSQGRELQGSWRQTAQPAPVCSAPSPLLSSGTDFTRLFSGASKSRGTVCPWLEVLLCTHAHWNSCPRCHLGVTFRRLSPSHIVSIPTKTGSPSKTAAFTALTGFYPHGFLFLFPPSAWAFSCSPVSSTACLHALLTWELKTKDSFKLSGLACSWIYSKNPRCDSGCVLDGLGWGLYFQLSPSASRPHWPRKPYILFLVEQKKRSKPCPCGFLPTIKQIHLYTSNITFFPSVTSLDCALCWSGGYFRSLCGGLFSAHPEPVLLTGSAILECLGRLPASVLPALGGLSHVLLLTFLFPRDLTQFCK